VLSATHHYNSDLHTMSLEVSTHKGMREILWWVIYLQLD
jgi:hypothetical protein